MDTSMTSVYRFLHIPEILSEVTHYLDRKTLSRTARVCTPLHDASIERLWSGLVLQIREEQIDKYGKILKHLRRLSPSDPFVWEEIDLESSIWTRIQHYSVHIKAIQISDESYWPDLFSIPSEIRARLFPRLQKLSVQWRIAVTKPKLEWLLFAGPQVRSLQIHEGMGGSAMNRCLRTLDSICQHISTEKTDLEELLCDDLMSDPKTPTMPSTHADSLSTAIKSLTNLRSFSWQSSTLLPQSILQILSTIPSLSRLSLYLPSPLQTGIGTEARFPSLRRLRLGGLEVRPESWLQGLSYPSLLTHLALGASLPSSFHSFNLISIEISKKYIPWFEFAPLLSCKSIRACKILSNQHMDGFGDSSLRTLASTWKNLEDLTIREARGQTNVTMLGLAPLAVSCLKLRNIEVDVTMDLQEEYGHSWRGEYLRVLGGEYPLGTLEGLCLTVQPPEKHDELVSGGLGTLGVARLIRRFWPAFNPSGLKQRYYDSPVSWQIVQAVMRAIILHDDKLSKILEEKERELKQMREERDSIREDYARLRLETSRLEE